MTTKKPQLVEIVPTETGWQRREWHSLSITHLPSDYPKDDTLANKCGGCGMEYADYIAEQEQRWGEPRLPTND